MRLPDSITGICNLIKVISIGEGGGDDPTSKPQFSGCWGRGVEVRGGRGRGRGRGEDGGGGRWGEAGGGDQGPRGLHP